MGAAYNGTRRIILSRISLPFVTTTTTTTTVTSTLSMRAPRGAIIRIVRAFGRAEAKSIAAVNFASSPVSRHIRAEYLILNDGFPGGFYGGMQGMKNYSMLHSD